jgi:glucose-1-phosphatase
MPHPCKAIIFDLGKVVFDLSFDRTFQYWADISGREFADLKNRFAFDESFEKFERAELLPSQFRTIVCSQLGLTLQDDEFDAGWCSLYLDTYSGIDELLIRLKQNYRVVALTNTNSIHHSVWPLKYSSSLRHFEKIFSSHELRTRKPEKESYRHVLDYLKVLPSETVFLDDNKSNVDAARELGINALLVSSPEQLAADLKTLGMLGSQS